MPKTFAVFERYTTPLKTVYQTTILLAQDKEKSCLSMLTTSCVGRTIMLKTLPIIL